MLSEKIRVWKSSLWSKCQGSQCTMNPKVVIKIFACPYKFVLID